MSLNKLNKIEFLLYWILQLTWGIFANILGFIVTIFVLIFLKGRMHKNCYGLITEVGGNWGGVSLGAFALCGSYLTETSDCYNPSDYEYVRRHEFGHSLQNIILGPLFIFVVAIPSGIRYWLARYGKLKSDYEAIWFERTATSWGTNFINKRLK